MDIINLKVVNNNLLALNDFVVRGRPKTNLSANAAAAATALTVFSINGFAQGNYYALIGYDSGNAEIKKMHASTAPTGTTLTLAAGLSFAHDAGEPVYFINYNQVEFSNSATAGGAKSTTGLGAKDIDPTKKWTACPDNTNTSGYAFARFKNEAGTTYSSYSAAAPYTNADYNTVEYMVNEALAELGTEFNDRVTPDRCVNWLNEGLRDIRKGKNKLSWVQSYQTVLGATARTTFRYSMPTDIYDKYSRKAIVDIRLGGRNSLIYTDPEHFFNQLLKDVHFTQVTTAATAGDTTIYINNSYDFESSGSVNIGGNTVTYTGVTRSATAGELTGVPASGTGAVPTAGFAENDWVFQNETESEPGYWTLMNGYIYVWPLCNSSWINYNIFIDYYKTITEVDSMDDQVDYIQYDILKNYLKWCIRAVTHNSGLRDLSDPHLQLYQNQLGVLIRKDRTPEVNTFRNVYEFHESGPDVNPAQTRRGQI